MAEDKDAFAGLSQDVRESMPWRRPSIWRRRLAWVGGLAVVVAALLYVALPAVVSLPRLQVENYPLIRVGMTRSEVKQLLGGPPGNYGRGHEGWPSLQNPVLPPGSVREVWCDDANEFEIYFDDRDRVVLPTKGFQYRQTGQVNSFDLAWRWLRLRLGR
jgi:hypothetical protein